MQLKRFVVFLLLVALLLPMIPPVTRAASSDTVYVRKHVSLVYDNSGSMSSDVDNGKNLKWTYASYATQIFAGLLSASKAKSVEIKDTR